MRRAALGEISRWWVRPWRAAAQAEHKGSCLSPYLRVSRCQQPGPTQTRPGVGLPSEVAAREGAAGPGAGWGTHVGAGREAAADQLGERRGSGLVRTVSAAVASARVACTWATAAQTAAVSCPSPWPRYSAAFAASSSARRKCSGPVISTPLVSCPVLE
jgi:hypothetical protein